MEQLLKKYEPKKCSHRKREYRCVECCGGGICQHKRRREFCKECGGSSICEHGNRTYRCKECKGNGICEHGKLKTYCKECEGNGICEHGKYKRHCVECDGNEICEHHKRRDICIDCKGNGICEHNKLRSYCKICDGYRLCKSEWCETISHAKYNGYCARCCIYIFPEIQVSRNYKTKEADVVNRITETFSDFTWVKDKKIMDGCSRRRPDFLLDVGIDEYKEWKRNTSRIINSKDEKELRQYLNSHQHVLPAVIWKPYEKKINEDGSNNTTENHTLSNDGYYGISLKSEDEKHYKNTSNNGKKVEKRDSHTDTVLETYETIAKAKEETKLSTMSYAIKTKRIFHDEYYFCLAKS